VESVFTLDTYLFPVFFGITRPLQIRVHVARKLVPRSRLGPFAQATFRLNLHLLPYAAVS